MPLVVRYFSNCPTCVGLLTIFMSLDIIKLSILSRDVYDCHELALFLRAHLAQSQKPLLAVGMGQHGQLSRVLSPISLVTHRLLPALSAPGQLTLAEVHQARHLIGQLPKREFSVVGDPVSGASVCRMHEAAFGELGFPHSVSFLAGNQQTEQALHQLLRKPAFGGAALVAASSGVNALGLVDSVSDAVKQIGVVDAIIVKEVNGERQLVGDNLTWEVIHSCAVRAGLMGALLDKGATAVIGGGDRKFAAIVCYAVKQLGFTTVRCIGHGDGDRSGDLAAAFPDIKIQEADSLDSLLKDLTNNQPLIVCSGIASEGTKVNAVINALSARDNGGAIIDLYADEGALAGIVSNRPMWKSFGSSSTLKELACRHFTAWTGRKAPESIIMDVI